MTDKTKTTKILEQILTITDSNCLVVIQTAVFEHRKDIRRKTAEVNTALWSVGDTVKMLPEHRNRKPYGAKGKIHKINKVKMVVDFGTGTIWNIPKSMLMIVE